ncbi:LysR family transcriptional regulator [Janthinobacterium sp. FW305-129]|uniref:LysR family transcriptional regulator n=1 Tax=Janthinobacterium sp. FW305-129 TaxID=2775054 RepID=UPI001E2D5902|nr:LysR family transcriptional regulator [Janthinobacterium sp. FW305-129]MCC7596158.1 LysR family transcriptional regulator [Janthinobacterium sp. FW305-129]
MQWTLEQMRYFEAAVAAGSFSGAARRLGRAQSVVSTSIGLLEAEFGVELFDRSRRSAVLTEAGKVMHLEACELLRQAERLQLRAQLLSEAPEAQLTLALDEALPYLAIGTLVKELAARYPALELVMLNATASEVAQYVEQQQADVAFHFDRGTISPVLEQQHIGSVAQGVFVAKGHPMAHGQEVSRNELTRYRQLIMDSELNREHAFSPAVWFSDSFYSIAEMVADELGWAILPLNIANYDNYKGYLQEVPCPALALSRLPVRRLSIHGKKLSETSLWLTNRLAELLADGPRG